MNGAPLTVVVSWNEQKEHHELDIQGKLLELLSVGDSKKATSLSTAACSLNLVAGGRNRRCLPKLQCLV